MKDAEARRAAIYLLTRGRITIAEAAELAGVSRQLMRHWVRRSGVDWRRVRTTVITKAWRKAMRRGR